MEAKGVCQDYDPDYKILGTHYVDNLSPEQKRKKKNT